MPLVLLLSLVTLTIHAPEYTADGPSPNTCTAVIVAPTLALTAGHCIEQAVIVAPIMADDAKSKPYPVTLVKYDADSDLALLRLPKPYKLRAKIGPAPVRGDHIETYNSGNDFTGTYNEGIVCTFAKDRDLPFHIIISNLSILAGASGGGIFNSRGELIGINRWAFKDGLSGAIDTATVTKFLIKNGVKL